MNAKRRHTELSSKYQKADFVPIQFESEQNSSMLELEYSLIERQIDGFTVKQGSTHRDGSLTSNHMSLLNGPSNKDDSS